LRTDCDKIVFRHRGIRSKYYGKGAAMKLQSTIRCPLCGHQKTEEMQVNACRFFYTCERCGMNIKPKAGDCCVFCSYGDVPCPPIQEARAQGDKSGRCAGT
jgi:hypothetical protein